MVGGQQSFARNDGISVEHRAKSKEQKTEDGMMEYWNGGKMGKERRWKIEDSRQNTGDSRKNDKRMEKGLVRHGDAGRALFLLTLD